MFVSAFFFDFTFFVLVYFLLVVFFFCCSFLCVLFVSCTVAAVSDLSCRKKDGDYYIVTDRWQKFTEEKITPELLDKLKEYADEFLVHAVDVEGKASGIEVPLAEMLGDWGRIPITYAGGVGSFEDLKQLKEYGKGRLNVTIGSALDLFGGRMAYKEVLQYINQV